MVAKGFTFPTTLLIDENENIYVAEAGYAYGPKTTLARVLRVMKNGHVEEVARDFEGPINGLALKGNMLYISHRGKITEINLESKERRDLVKDLPSLGDHQNNDLIFGKTEPFTLGREPPPMPEWWDRTILSTPGRTGIRTFMTSPPALLC